MSIERTERGIIDYCLQQIENIDDEPDIKFSDKVRYKTALLKEVRGFASLGLQNKKLMMQSPEIAKNTAIVLSIGSQEPKAVDDKKDEKAAG